MYIGKNWAFIHNPRTSGTNITAFLRKNTEGQQSVIHYNYQDGITYNLLNDVEYIFGFVRNPYEREFSWYMKNRNQFGLRSGDFKKITFKEYVMSPVFKHIRDQSELFVDEDGNIPERVHVYKYEERDIALEDIAPRIGVDVEAWKQFKLFPNRVGDTSNWKNEYDQEMLDFLEPYFQKDFELFGYEPLKL